MEENQNQNQAAHIEVAIKAANKPKGKTPEGKTPKATDMAAIEKRIAAKVVEVAPPSKRGAILRHLSKVEVLSAMESALEGKTAALKVLFGGVSGGSAITEYALAVAHPIKAGEVNLMLTLADNRRSPSATAAHLSSGGLVHKGVLKTRLAEGVLYTWGDKAGNVIRSRYAPKA